MKTCRKCRKELSLNQFYRRGVGGGTFLSSECKSCTVQLGLEWRKKIAVQKNFRRYGLSISDYEEMNRAQGGGCAVCGLPDNQKLGIDHCHQTGRVRGLLCKKCNTALGMVGDEPSLLEQLKVYLAVA